jgi:hypothetical protein
MDWQLAIRPTIEYAKATLTVGRIADPSLFFLAQ